MNTLAAAPAKRAGRKKDTTGHTALGKARLIHAANPDASAAELKRILEVELKEFNLTSKVIGIYASMVRRPASVPHTT